MMRRFLSMARNSASVLMVALVMLELTGTAYYYSGNTWACPRVFKHL
jgi:hypothetical protein